MRKTRMSAAMAAGAALVAAQTIADPSANSCIISGSTERPYATEAWADAGDLDSGVTSRLWDSPLDLFEARFMTRLFGTPLNRFRSDEPRGISIIIR